QTASPLYDRSTKHLITHPLHDAPPILSPAGPTAGTPAFWLVRSSRAPTSNSIRLEPSRHWTNPPTLSEARLGCASRKKPAFVGLDRKSTRLNSSHVKISYAVFCLK